MQKLMAAVAFGSVQGNEVDLAVEELGRAGFTVFRMPAWLRECDDDDFIEAQIDVAGTNPVAELEAMWDTVGAIVGKHRGSVIEWGRVGPAHEPLASFFSWLNMDARPFVVGNEVAELTR